MARYRAAQLARNRANPGPSRARARRQYKRVKRLATANLGGRCAECGGVEGLELDHIARLRAGVRRMRNEWNRAARGDTGNLQLLCADCPQGQNQ